MGMDSVAYYEQVYSCSKNVIFTRYFLCKRDFNVTVKEHRCNDPAVVPCSKPYYTLFTTLVSGFNAVKGRFQKRLLIIADD